MLQRISSNHSYTLDKMALMFLHSYGYINQWVHNVYMVVLPWKILQGYWAHSGDLWHEDYPSGPIILGYSARWRLEEPLEHNHLELGHFTLISSSFTANQLIVTDAHPCIQVGNTTQLTIQYVYIYMYRYTIPQCSTSCLHRFTINPYKLQLLELCLPTTWSTVMGGQKYDDG